jgi:hypothetical protein
MNKPTLITIGRQLGDKLYVFSVYDLEPSGILVQAYNQATSTEYLLSITEKELVATNLNRSKESLQYLLDNISLEPYGTGLALQASFETINRQKKRPTGDEVEAYIKSGGIGPENKSVHDILCSGMVELCKNKPGGLAAVKWLGEWLLANNPQKPCVEEE